MDARCRAIALEKPRDADALMLKKPDVSYDTDPELLEMCYRLWAVSGYRDMPNPYEVALLPIGYVSEMFSMMEQVQFYRDLPKRPAYMSGTKGNA